jgi:hypothetical protein
VIYSINYDLNIPGQNYDRVRHAIEALGPSYKALKSTFLVRTSKSANEVWGSIHSAFDATDRCLVSEVTANHSGWLGKDVWEWVNQQSVAVWP